MTALVGQPASIASGRTDESRGKIVHIVQGEQRVSDDPSLVMTTLLGSCVAACLRDPIAGIGGMNHYLVPGDLRSSGEARRHGVHAMELLINALLAHGASRSRLQAKIFGGACMMDGLTDVGSQNAAFAREFLRSEDIAITAECLGGRLGRRVQYWPVSGRARRSFMTAIPLTEPPARAFSSGNLELF